MDTQIIKGIITGVATIVAAIIAYKAHRKKHVIVEKIEYDKLFLLGANIAKIGWGKVFSTDETESLKSITIDLLDELDLRKSAKNMLENFISKEATAKELRTSLPKIKKDFGNYIYTFYSKKAANYFYLGFNIIHVSISMEVIAISNTDSNDIKNQLKGIIVAAKGLKLPTKKLSKVQKKINSGDKSDLLESQGLVIDIGDEYFNYLHEKRKVKNNT